MFRDGPFEHRTYLDYYLHVCGLCRHWLPEKLNSFEQGFCCNSECKHNSEALGFDCMAGRRCRFYEPNERARLLRSRA